MAGTHSFKKQKTEGEEPMNIDETHCDDKIFLGRYCYAELFV